MKVRRWIPFVSLTILSLILATTAGAQEEQLWVGPNVNMVSGTTWPDGDPFLQRQNEPSVAGSTRDSMTLMGFVNDYRTVDIPGLPEGKETGDSWLGVFKSFDGGLTWRSTLLPGYPQDDSPEGLASHIHGYDAGADPVVRAGTHGLFFLTGIVFDRGDAARSGVFVTRYMDLNNQESGDPIEYIDTEMVKSNDVGDYFIDKPWMAVDIPRSGALSAQLTIDQDGTPVYQDIPCGNVYLAWAEIFGVPPTRRSRIMFSYSTDCGGSWEAPIELSAPDTLNQGVTMAVSPTNGDVWVAWRQFDIADVITSCAIGGGYWKNHPEEWPVEFITMGGVGYDKASALDILNTPTRGDASYILAKQLIPAKLNVASGALDATLHDTIAAADAWLVANPLGDDNKPEGTAKDEGLEIKDILEAYNEGLLIPESCPPSATIGGTGNAILAVHSNGFGGIGTFTTPTVVSTLYPLEQATTSISFRTNAYPTITVGTSENEPEDRAYLAWTTRGEALPRTDPVDGDGRIVVSTSINGVDWTIPNLALVDQPGVPGHQLKPTITFAGGKVLLAYLDLRYDHSGVFERFIADWPSMDSYRHTVDVRAAQADPADEPVFTHYSLVDEYADRPSDQVSRYVFIPYLADPNAPPEPYNLELLQFQFNPPNLPIFVGGTRPFFGDYIDLGASPPFVPDLNNTNGGWRYNTDPGDGVTFHAVWTDNRDVEAPHDGDWSNYVPPQHFNSGGPSLFDPNQIVPDCETTPGGYGQTRIRDQNTYTARISRGLFVASPGSSRATNTVQRAFVVFVQNDTQEARAFHLDIEIPGQSSVNASFEQFSSLTDLEMEIPGFSSASRTVFVDSQLEERPSIRVNVVEIDGLDGSPTSGGLSSSILLNPDPTSPPSADPELDYGEVYNLAMMNPAMMNLAMMNPAMMNPAMMNLAMMNLAMMNPAMMNLAMMNLAMMNPAMMNLAMMNLAMMNPAMMNPAMMNQAVYSLAMMNPAMMNPAMMNLAMMNPAMMNLAMMNPAMMNASLTDLTWEVKHEGNAAAAYSVNMVMEEAPEGFTYELLVYRLYTTPVADGCELTEEAQHQMLVHIIDPDLLTGDLLDPGNTDPDIGNATFWMEPGDQIYVTLRVVDPWIWDDVVFDPTELTVATVAQGVNTEDAQAGSTQPPYSIPDISVPTLLTMDGGRTEHTSTLLPDGTILITGGFDPVSTLDTAEIYDPGAKTFSATGPMNSPRAYHTATVLDDGTVLVVGAPAGGVVGPSAELYDPVTGLFTDTTGDLHQPRGGHRATLLADGRVLITGGNTSGPTTLNTAEIYDPVDDDFTVLADTMTHPRWEHTATLLSTGEVLVTGGFDGVADQNTAELFDLTTDTFSDVPGTMSDQRRFHSATLLPDGTVLLAGGLFDSTFVANTSADIYDRASNSLIPAGDMNQARAAQTATLMADGKVLLAGGSTHVAGSLQLLSHIEMYDWSTGAFDEKGDMTIERSEHSAVRMPDGKVLITGGTTYGAPITTGTDIAELYVPAAPAKFYMTGSLNEGRNYHVVSSLPGGDVLVVGGTDGDSNAIASIERYSSGLGTFATVATMSPGPGRMYPSATLLQDGTVLIAGGLDGYGGTILNTALIYDPSDDSLTPTTGTLQAWRWGHTATLLQDGRVLIVGGRGNTGILTSTEIYDPALGTFTLSEDLTTGRNSHTAVLLNDGRVLIAGGGPGVGVTNTFEVWDSGTFDPKGVMNDPRASTLASLLSDGTVLIAGGHDGADWLETAEIFDPISNTFSYTFGNMKLARGGHASIRLPSGEVLIAGGVRGSVVSPVLLSEAEIYDPITQTFALTDVLNIARSGPRATRLADGRVLFIGGWEFYRLGGSVPSPVAEVYNPIALASGGSKVLFLQQPQTVPVGGLPETPVRVLVQDEFGTPLPGYTVTLQVDPGTANAHDNVEITDGSGIATFPSLWIDRTGNGLQVVAIAENGGIWYETVYSTAFNVIPLIVTNTNDDGPGSLRRAIENAERNYDWAEVIEFNIPGPGTHTITLATGLPMIFFTVWIDGSTQPDYSGTPLIQLDGSVAGLSTSGLFFAAGEFSLVRGLMITNFSSCGIRSNSRGIRIEENYIGTDGVNDLGNSTGIYLEYATDEPFILRNTISGNVDGIVVEESSPWVSENMIGTNPAGNSAIPNSGVGIAVTGEYGFPIENNVISGNGSDGVVLDDTRNISFEENKVGTDFNGITAIGNVGAGVVLRNGTFNVGITFNTISGNGGNGIHLENGAHDNLVRENVISGNAGIGVGVGSDVSDSTSTGNAIDSNSIYGNGGLGIDLGSDGPTSNDETDLDTGPNELINHPTISAANGNTVHASLNSTPNSDFVVQFFSSPTCVHPGTGEGTRFVGETFVTTLSSGDVNFIATLPVDPTEMTEMWITATASSLTIAGGNTSEFSPCYQEGP